METRTLCALTLLLFISPLSARKGWMRLGLQDPDWDPEPSLDCVDLDLNPVQLDLCLQKPFLLPSVRVAARLAVSECQNQFRHERWNCSARRDPEPGFGPELTAGTKETAFIHAAMGAGLVHAVTRACSLGNLTECGCDARLQGGPTLVGGDPAEGWGSGGGNSLVGGAPAEGWHWGGCSDHTQYGTWFSRHFMDGTIRNESISHGGFTLDAMNRHNSEAGRQAVEQTMTTGCRCHGVSGSCAVKTCWRSMAAFHQVGEYLKERYEHSIQVRHTGRRRPRRRQQRRPDKHQLIFINRSPNYCVEDRRRGVLGTHGRRCSRGGGGVAGACGVLCCGRGYNTHVVRHTQRCSCTFVWCCYVRCRRCESLTDLHTCK